MPHTVVAVVVAVVVSVAVAAAGPVLELSFCIIVHGPVCEIGRGSESKPPEPRGLVGFEK